jgi:hypothetical protein
MYQHGFGQKSCPSSARCPKVAGLHTLKSQFTPLVISAHIVDLPILVMFGPQSVNIMEYFKDRDQAIIA